LCPDHRIGLDDLAGSALVRFQVLGIFHSSSQPAFV
jgi:hypothetical protein